MSAPAILEQEEQLRGEIAKASASLERHFSEQLRVDQNLTRAMVSFQANKVTPGYRWFKFKEGFSAAFTVVAATVKATVSATEPDDLRRSFQF